MIELIPWLLAALAAAAAFGFFLRVRSATEEAGSAQVEVDLLRGELESAREEVAKSGAKQRQVAEESRELRKKLDKAKRRAQRGAQATPKTSRVPELEAELEQTRQARDAAREEAEGLAGELSRLRAAGPPKPPEKPLLDNAGVEALQGELASARESLVDAQKKLGDQERAVAKLKGRLDTQEQLYVSMRGELAAKKDRLRTQQEELERLQAFKVAVVDPVPKDEVPPPESPPPPAP